MSEFNITQKNDYISNVSFKAPGDVYFKRKKHKFCLGKVFLKKWQNPATQRNNNKKATFLESQSPTFSIITKSSTFENQPILFDCLFFGFSRWGRRCEKRVDGSFSENGMDFWAFCCDFLNSHTTE